MTTADLPMPASKPGAEAQHQQTMSALTLGALGVVFGDIGTSPLYALRECFSYPGSLGTTPENVLGVLSLILWALILVISVQYMVFILRADNRGEGGILALMTLVVRRNRDKQLQRSVFIMLGLFGAALLCADAMITPAISVLSATEGLRIVTPLFEAWVIPISVAILVALYLVQYQGTERIGVVFGPVMLLWFVVLGLLGVLSIAQTPEILSAIDPRHAVLLFESHGWLAYAVVGSVFLVVTGGEALYADMGHFGRTPVRLGWFFIALPGLALNYLGQGALLLRQPEAVHDLFYSLTPGWALVPMVLLATLATVIASQAVITGAFSLASQAVNLGYSPRLEIRQTSAHTIGQVYVPSVNYLFMFGTLGLVFAFQSSGALAGAYGTAVSTTMLATTLLLYGVARNIWGWSRPASLLFMAPFLTIGICFFTSNLLKIPDGGWLPLVAGGAIYALSSSWNDGRRLLYEQLASEAFPMELFCASLAGSKTLRVPGTAVFLTADPTGVPRAMLHNLKHNKVLHEQVVILTVDIERVPYVSREERLHVEATGHGIYRASVRYGFLEQPDIPETLTHIDPKLLAFDPMDTTFFLGRESLLLSPNPRLDVSRWRRALFAFMSRNAQSAANFFRIPPNRVVELGAQVEI
jgi:KUP system potassium uptake protein